MNNRRRKYAQYIFVKKKKSVQESINHYNKITKYLSSLILKYFLSSVWILSFLLLLLTDMKSYRLCKQWGRSLKVAEPGVTDSPKDTEIIYCSCNCSQFMAVKETKTKTFITDINLRIPSHVCYGWAAWSNCLGFSWSLLHKARVSMFIWTFWKHIMRLQGCSGSTRAPGGKLSSLLMFCSDQSFGTS